MLFFCRRNHVVHEEIGKMLGTDYDQRFGAGFLNRLAHPVETFIQPVAQDGIGAVGTPRGAAWRHAPRRAAAARRQVPRVAAPHGAPASTAAAAAAPASTGVAAARG